MGNNQSKYSRSTHCSTIHSENGFKTTYHHDENQTLKSTSINTPVVITASDVSPTSDCSLSKPYFSDKNDDANDCRNKASFIPLSLPIGSSSFPFPPQSTMNMLTDDFISIRKCLNPSFKKIMERSFVHQQQRNSKLDGNSFSTSSYELNRILQTWFNNSDDGNDANNSTNGNHGTRYSTYINGTNNNSGNSHTAVHAHHQQSYLTRLSHENRTKYLMKMQCLDQQGSYGSVKDTVLDDGCSVAVKYQRISNTSTFKQLCMEMYMTELCDTVMMIGGPKFFVPIYGWAITSSKVTAKLKPSPFHYQTKILQPKPQQLQIRIRDNQPTEKIRTIIKSVLVMPRANRDCSQLFKSLLKSEDIVQCSHLFVDMCLFVCASINVLWRLGCRHRDLKANNVLCWNLPTVSKCNTNPLKNSTCNAESTQIEQQHYYMWGNMYTMSNEYSSKYDFRLIDMGSCGIIKPLINSNQPSCGNECTDDDDDLEMYSNVNSNCGNVTNIKTNITLNEVRNTLKYKKSNKYNKITNDKFNHQVTEMDSFERNLRPELINEHNGASHYLLLDRLTTKRGNLVVASTLRYGGLLPVLGDMLALFTTNQYASPHAATGLSTFNFTSRVMIQWAEQLVYNVISTIEFADICGRKDYYDNNQISKEDVNLMDVHDLKDDEDLVESEESPTKNILQTILQDVNNNSIVIVTIEQQNDYQQQHKDGNNAATTNTNTSTNTGKKQFVDMTTYIPLGFQTALVTALDKSLSQFKNSAFFNSDSIYTLLIETTTSCLIRHIFQQRLLPQPHHFEQTTDTVQSSNNKIFTNLIVTKHDDNTTTTKICNEQPMNHITTSAYTPPTPTNTVKGVVNYKSSTCNVVNADMFLVEHPGQHAILAKVIDTKLADSSPHSACLLERLERMKSTFLAERSETNNTSHQ